MNDRFRTKMIALCRIGLLIGLIIGVINCVIIIDYIFNKISPDLAFINTFYMQGAFFLVIIMIGLSVIGRGFKKIWKLALADLVLIIGAITLTIMS